MQGDTQQTQTERESRTETANRKGQVLTDKRIAKDEAMRAGSIFLSWVASSWPTSETSTESQAPDCGKALYLPELVKAIQQIKKMQLSHWSQ